MMDASGGASKLNQDGGRAHLCSEPGGGSRVTQIVKLSKQ